MRVRGLCLIGVALALVGCWNPPSYRSSSTYEYQYGVLSPSVYQRASEQPSSGLEAAAVTSALNELAERELAAAAAADAWAAERLELSAADAVKALDTAYAKADTAGAEALIASHPQLVSWDDAQREGTIAVNTTFKRTNGEGFAYVSLSLPTIRSDAPALGIAIPPGTYAVVAATVPPTADGAVEGERWVDPNQERRYGQWPAVQDLAFLNAGGVVLSAADPVVTVKIPVACASFEKKAPSDGTRFELARFPQGSDVERLLVQLCAERAEEPEPAEAQIAVWLARNRMSWKAFVAEGGPTGRLSTFSRNQAIYSGRHAAGAARLLLESGTDPRGLGFFSDGEDSGPIDVPAAELLPAAEPTEAEPVEEEALPEQPEAPVAVTAAA